MPAYCHFLGKFEVYGSKAMKNIGMCLATAILAVSLSYAQPRPGGQGGPPQGGMRMDGRSMSSFGLLRRPEVQKEIGLTAAQKTKIDAAMSAMRPKQGEKFDAKKMEAAIKKSEATINSTLTAAQKARLKQLSYQRVGITGVLMPDVSKALGITDAQKKKMTSIYETEIKKIIGTPKPGERPNFDRTKMEAAMKKITTQITAVLTATQRAKWTQMQGKPFKFTQTAPIQRRDGGGI